MIMLSLLAGVSAIAQETRNDEELFQGDDLVTGAETGNKDTGSYHLLVTEEAVIGGKITLTHQTSLDAEELDDPANQLDLLCMLFLDAPDEDEPNESSQLTQLTELFSDFNINALVYVRAGKQNVTWGTGYYFSPADIINLQTIDPEDPSADREGPLAVKFHLPAGTTNFYLYLILDEIVNDRITVAPKIEFVLGGTEFGLGGYYRQNSAIAGMATISSSLGDVGLFAEAMAMAGSSKTFIRETDDLVTYPLGLRPYTQPDTVFFSATTGFNYSYLDDFDNFNLSFQGQYYYNGTGYDDLEIFSRNAIAVGMLAGSGVLDKTDMASRGMHYAAAGIQLMELFQTDFSLGVFWIMNLQDLSGTLSCSLQFTPNDYVTITVGIRQVYGDDRDEYAPQGDSLGYYFKTSIGTGKF